jgi:cyanate permease
MASISGIVGLGLAPGVFYMAVVMVTAALDGQSIGRVLCFHPDRTLSAGFARQVAALAAVFASVGFLFAVPGVLGMIAIGRWP